MTIKTFHDPDLYKQQYKGQAHEGPDEIPYSNGGFKLWEIILFLIVVSLSIYSLFFVYPTN